MNENFLAKLPPYVSKQIVSITSTPISWSLKQMQIPDTWKVTQGENITTLVIDTGMPNHKDVVPNIIKEKCVDFTGEGLIDLNSHSTFVCSEICAINNIDGIVGIAPKSKVITAKVLTESGSGTLDWILKGLDYALDIKNDYQIINMSLGYPVYSKELEDRIQALYKAGKILICAAGNEQRGQGQKDTTTYPARFAGQGIDISVGAYDEQGNIADFSSIGEELTFAFPGVNILGCGLKDTYVLMSGTSMASPGCVGAAVLCLSKHLKQFTDTGKNDCITFEQLVEHFKKYAIDKGTIGKDITYGWGAVDVDDLIVKDEEFVPITLKPPLDNLSFFQKIVNYLKNFFRYDNI